MDDFNFVIGVMRENYNAVGFIPQTSVQSQYIDKGRYIVQRMRDGRRVGYLLHGSPKPGGILTIAQAVIDFDHRQQGHGVDVVRELVSRAQLAGSQAIKLRCAEDLAANEFWQRVGFEHVGVLTPDNVRKRAINVYMMDLASKLF